MFCVHTHALTPQGEISLTRQVELMKGLSTVHFSSGQVVYREGDLSDALYFMLGPTEPDAQGHTDEGCELTTETKEKEDRGGDEDRDGDGPQRVFPFIPTKRFFGEEGLVYR